MDDFDPFTALPQRDAPVGWGGLERGRYIYPDPITGERRSWQRVSNFVDTIADAWALVPWEKRTMLYGLTVREDLYIKLCGLDPIRDKAAFDAIADEAKVAGGGEAGANVGTGLHGFFEQSDLGEPVRAPERFRSKIELRAQALAKAQLTVVPELRELKVIIPSLGVAGRFDEALRTHDGHLLVGDDKTEDGKTKGEKPKFEFYDYCHPTLQLAMYANAEYIWDEKSLTYRDAPDFNKDIGILIWSPKNVDYCEIKTVDIAEGWRYCLEVIPRVREFRNQGKRVGGRGLSGTYVPGCIKAPNQVELYAAKLRDAETMVGAAQLALEARNLGLWGDELASLYIESVNRITISRLTSS